MRFLFICLIGILLVSSAVAETRPFAELWNNVAYYDTNVERKGFSSLLGRFEGKLGLFLLDTPLQVYGAYYGVSSQSPDYWDNAVYYGPGIRFKPFEGFKGSGWQDEWVRDVKIFAESLNASYFKNAVSAEANKKTDTRYGLDLWHEWNLDKPDLTNCWGEFWANLSYRSTNFTTLESGSYIFYFQPKLGRHLGQGIEVYLRGDLTSSDKTDYWLNVADYGVGIRFEPWRETADKGSLLKKFKMFVEVLSASYLKEKPDPGKTVSSDVRFGIDFSYGR